MTFDGFRTATNVSRETMGRLQVYAGLLLKWNQVINLVARDSLADLWRRHFLDSAQLWQLLPPPTDDRPRVLVDLGSGAGFPGLVLAIMGAGAVHLVDADQRKATFLREVARATDTEVVVHDCRIEDLPIITADVVTARACAPLDRLLGLVAPLLRPATDKAPGGIGLFLKGRSLQRELTDSTGKWKMRFDLHPSRTDPAANILRLSDLTKGSEQP
ncbi:MAG: 16S rRNA (guanine(527)-N(7))-methyltransferase RsmG [Alphaproteobacteria bacterium]